MDTLGHVLALRVTPDRAEGERLVDAVQDATTGSNEVTFADQGYNGEKAEAAARTQGVDLVIVRLPEAKRGFVPAVADALDRGTVTGLDNPLPAPGQRL